MEPAPLPSGHALVVPTAADAEVIFELFAAHNLDVIGTADLTLDDIVEEIAEPGFDLATDSWLTRDAEGRPSGFACTSRPPGSAEHRMEVVADDPALARWLRDRAVARSLELGAADGHAEVTIDIGVYRADAVQQDLLAEAGFATGATFHRLRIDHGAGTEAPELPAEVVRRTGDEGDAVRRAGHAVIEAAFDGQFGITAQPYDEWHAVRDARSTFTWSQLVVLEVDGVAVAACEQNDQFVPDERCGYIARLAVAEESRGRGLAKLLLRDAFAAHAAAGRVGTILHVDTDNPTPALGLYTSVGMELVLVIDVWRSVRPVHRT